MSPPVRVLIVDDSPIFQAALAEVLQAHPGLRIAGFAEDGLAALEEVERLQPDVVVMDLHMPRLGGLEAISRIMATRPTPIIVMTADPRGEDVSLCFEAVARGALELIAKPRLVDGDEAVQRALQERIRLLAGVPVVYHPRRGERVTPARPGHRRDVSGRPVVGIVASAGGPAAVAAVLAQLPGDLPCGIVVVQHLWPGFARHLSSWLGQVTSLRVAVATEGAAIEAGSVWIGPEDAHVRVTAARRLTLDRDAAPVDGHRPSGTVLLSSMAQSLGDAAIGVVLSGMGRDGADGLLQVRRAGGVTIAQDAQTAVVDGMPRAAREHGAAAHVLPLDAIGPALAEAARGGPREGGAGSGR